VKIPNPKDAPPKKVPNDRTAQFSSENSELAAMYSVVALAQDEGYIGQALREVPAWILREADRWAEWNADYETKHEKPDRLGLPDPWQFLLKSPAVRSCVKEVCRAAQSTLWAWHRVGRMRMGFATLNTDFHEAAMKAKAEGNEAEYNRLITKFADMAVLYARVQADVRANAKNPEIVRQMERCLKKRQAQLIHRGERKNARQSKQWQTWADFARRNRLVAVLVSWWIKLPKEIVVKVPDFKIPGKSGLMLESQRIPGLMFFRNDALTEFLKFALQNKALTPAAVKKTRQQLGLIPVGKKNHPIWYVSFKQRRDGDLEMNQQPRGKKDNRRRTRRPRTVFNQVVCALGHLGWKKISVGHYVKTVNQVKMTIKTCSDVEDDDFFWIVFSKR
jgi:hypothetical protein